MTTKPSSHAPEQQGLEQIVSRTFAQLVNRLAEPHKDLSTGTERRTAKVLALVILVYVLMLLPLTLVVMIQHPSYPGSWAMLVTVLTYMIYYGVSRTRHYRYAGVLFGFTLAAGIIAPILLVRNQLALYTTIPYLPLSFMILKTVGTHRHLWGLYFSTAIGILTCSFLIPGVEMEIWISLQSLIAISLGLSITDLWLANEEHKELEFERAVLYQQSKLATLGEVASGVAHEINNPLAVLSIATENLEKKCQSGTLNPEEAIPLIQKMNQNIHRITHIVRSMRRFSRESHADPMTPAYVKDIVEDALGLCQERIRNHGTTLNIRYSNPDLQIQCRSAEISQVLLNLIMNSFDAIQSLPQHWIHIEVTQAKTKSVSISVTDSGPGIPEHIRRNMMIPFYTTKPPGKGTGLGLSISHAIIQAHGGNLRYDESSKNTRFVIELPTISQPPTPTQS